MEKLRPWIRNEAKGKLREELLLMAHDLAFGTEHLNTILDKYSDRVFFISSAAVTSGILS